MLNRLRRCGHGPALILLVLLAALAPLAEASPPDSLWIVGIYDEADLDQAIEAALSTTGEIKDSLILCEPTDTLRNVLLPFDTAFVPVAVLSTFPVRAPPADTPSQI